ncbi:hypothetical protein [Aneurinibacillus aneurinilyticus]|jgi:hypothetical protein|uniref:Uncharacterized protein n=2 Tax=Aneurinibacillus aneurinilyticus TaxID=1391 RepID=A0A848D3V6_ANEAE|nr:hypothetical protein [Aneurinibacillus aneurinilyticus]ERI10727.1 hypothetical protein HMPREF0083_01145 [Aneurinibacillus aneurinilyticus ATCC 12856]MCI1696564.1 hypothetical protein [Aneurinibacillus aneurinilyticus]MED0709252.1 hypothetical protein [Aneurinibacillus aneurinilyticus]MED0724882.1 hypothetical protein [Aneurinibacillus aneurinilyticus]MED0732503.1 hypothetical protein [Aneurinibacillus aneurinilyticus]
MPAFRRTLTENIGKWTVINTKAGAFHVKIESANNKGVTVLLPNYYTVNDPSVKLIEKNIKVKAEDAQTAQRFFTRGGSFACGRCFFPFSFFLFPFFFF